MFLSLVKSVAAISLGAAVVAPAFAQAAADAATLSAAGEQALRQGHYAEAQVDFERLAQIDPRIAEIHVTLAAIYFKERQYDSVVKEIAAAQRLKPGLPKVDSLLGLALSEMGRFSEALPHLDKGFKPPNDSDVRRMCGLELLRVFTGLSRDSDAVKTALELNQMYPDDPEVLYQTGRIYGNFAYLVMEKLHDSAPNSIWMLQAQGEANESAKNYDAALAAFRHELELDPRRSGVHYRMGRVYLSRFREGHNQADRDAAAQEFAGELEVEPGSGNALYELGVFSAEDGKPDQARARFEEVIARFPDFEEALVALGGCYLQLSKPADALEPLRHAVKLRPDDEVAWYRLAHAERAMGNADEAAKSMTEFRKLHDAAQANPARHGAENELTPQTIDADANAQANSQ